MSLVNSLARPCSMIGPDSRHNGRASGGGSSHLEYVRPRCILGPSYSVARWCLAPAECCAETFPRLPRQLSGVKKNQPRKKTTATGAASVSAARLAPVVSFRSVVIFFSWSLSLSGSLSPTARPRTPVTCLLMLVFSGKGPGLNAGEADGTKKGDEAKVHTVASIPAVSTHVFDLSDNGQHSLQGTNRRWAFLQGTHADATCPLVFLCGLGGVLWSDSGMAW